MQLRPQYPVHDNFGWGDIKLVPSLAYVQVIALKIQLRDVDPVASRSAGLKSSLSWSVAGAMHTRPKARRFRGRLPCLLVACMSNSRS